MGISSHLQDQPLPLRTCPLFPQLANLDISVEFPIHRVLVRDIPIHSSVRAVSQLPTIPILTSLACICRIEWSEIERSPWDLPYVPACRIPATRWIMEEASLPPQI